MSNEKFSGGQRRSNPSLFGPILLIAIGAYFLLRNLGMLPETLVWNWTAVFQLWPLWLIFLGVNILVQQAPRPLGSFLSGIVGLTAVGVLGYVLFFAADNPLLARLGVASAPESVVETISYTPDDVSQARVEIDFSLPGAALFALDDSRALIEGQVSHFGGLNFETEQAGSTATVKLSAQDGSSWLWFANPANWGNFSMEAWRIGLHPGVETDLRLRLATGAADLDLSALQLSNLRLDGGTGYTDLRLPGGDYRAEIDAGTGALTVRLGDYGRQQIDVDGGTGSMTFSLPEGMEARVRVSSGTGSFNIDQSRFTQVSGRKADSGVWETAAFREGMDDGVELIIDISTGSVQVRSG